MQTTNKSLAELLRDVAKHIEDISDDSKDGHKKVFEQLKRIPIVKNCSYCGRNNADDAIYCCECGTAFFTVSAPIPITIAKLPSLRSCMSWVIAWHIVSSFILVGLLEMDLSIWFAAVVAYWSAVGVGLIRRKGQLTQRTAWVVSHGLVMVCIIAICIFYFIWRLRGLFVHPSPGPFFWGC